MQTFIKYVAGILIGITSIFGGQHTPIVQAPISQNLGATNVIDTPVALFTTSLASPITAISNTMTLVSGANGDGGTLASSTYSFIIDEGQSDQEFVRADCANTACTGMVRGLSMVDGSTTIPSLAQPHRRGQSVKITDAPLLLVITNIINGNNGFPKPISYTASVATSSFNNDQQIPSKAYVDQLAFNGAGVINATTGARGVVQLSTGAQASSNTATGGTGASLALTSSISSSTAPASGNYVVVTNSTGKIDSTFLPAANISPTGSITAYASTTAPTGWFLLDGSAHSTSTYPDLYNLIGYTYGSTSAGANFNVPDLRGRQILMASSTAAYATSTGNTGGEASHTLTQNEIPAYNLPFVDTNLSGGTSLCSGTCPGVIFNASGGSTYKDVSGVSSTGGGGTALNVLDPYFTLEYIIKY